MKHRSRKNIQQWRVCPYVSHLKYLQHGKHWTAYCNWSLGVYLREQLVTFVIATHWRICGEKDGSIIYTETVTHIHSIHLMSRLSCWTCAEKHDLWLDGRLTGEIAYGATIQIFFLVAWYTLFRWRRLLCYNYRKCLICIFIDICDGCCQ